MDHDPFVLLQVLHCSSEITSIHVEVITITRLVGTNSSLLLFRRTLLALAQTDSRPLSIKLEILNRVENVISRGLESDEFTSGGADETRSTFWVPFTSTRRFDGETAETVRSEETSCRIEAKVEGCVEFSTFVNLEGVHLFSILIAIKH